MPLGSIYTMPSHLFCSNRHLRWALRAVSIVIVIAFVGVLSSAVFGANPAEEMAKAGATGGIDPKGNSWVSIQKSIEQFAHPSFILRLFLSLSLAVGCAFAIAWHPRRASIRNPLADFEERKALILLGVVGAVVAELSGTSQTLAFVIFGIGALLRFRTVLDNPKLTGKAIMVVVVGLACGMGSWAMAVFVTAFSWLLMFWLDSHSSCRCYCVAATRVSARTSARQASPTMSRSTDAESASRAVAKAMPAGLPSVKAPFFSSS